MNDLVRSHLTRLTSLSGSAPSFDVDGAPDAPGPLFEEWFSGAIAAGVEEPHAMTLSTVDDDGMPDARVLILKDFDPAGRWAFSSGSESAKGHQLATHPSAALTFYWPSLVRSIRLRGTVTPDHPDASRTDFLARGPVARALAISGRQSSPLTDPARLDREVAEALERLALDPGAGAEGWRKYWLAADVVEFWQGERDRRHIRVRYRRQHAGWARDRLRP